ncbi:unnamed protein product [Symbiodinium sp. CCMP2592]|nr:unnamed protein product [Symbiodinium sp. CCMP2592]
MHVVGNANGVYKTRSVRRLPAEDQVSKELLDSLKATPWDPRGRQEESAHFVLPAQSEASPAAAPAVSDPQGAQDAAGSSADGTSGSKRSAEAPPEDAPSQLRARLEQSQGEKREISTEVPDSATKLRRISAVLEDRLVDTSCVASVTTRDGLEVPVEVNVDRAEELQALRASEPVVWYDTEFDKEQELQGMQKERESLQHFDVFEEKLVSECSEEQLRDAISTQWVKRPKGDGVRCRLCVRGFDQVVEDPDDTFASTPSLATLKLLLTLACTFNWFVLAGDVSTAFLHALLSEEIFVIPPGEFYPNGGVLWKLRRAMYGLKQSPKAWQTHFASVMADLGFKRLKSDPNLYFHPEYKVYLLCYVDDVLLFGAKEPCEHLFAKLQERLLLRREGTLQPGESINFLGRCITRREDAIEISMPTSYVDKILEEYALLECRHSPPGNDSLRKKIESEEPLDTVEHRKYRRVVGQLLWLSSIRPDIQYAVKELSRGSTSPTEAHKAKVKMLLRYLAGSKDFMAAAAPLGCDFVPHFVAAMASAWVSYFWLGSWQLRFGIRFCMDGLRTSYRIVPTSVGTWFWYRLLCDRRLQWFVCFYFEKMAPKLQVPVPKAVALGLPPAALPGPSTSEEAEMTRDFRNFVEEHQFYVPDPNFERDELPPRLPTRALPQNTWLELRYASGNFETVCGLHPAHFQQLHRAVDVLRVHFYGKEAARLLGHGRDHLGWSHFAGMSYFAVDNVCFTHFKHVPDFLESLRQGRQISKLLLPGTSDFRLVYALLRLQPGVDNPVVTALQSAALFPELFARSTSYVANETDFCINFKASYIGPNFVDVLPEPSIRLWFCTSLNFHPHAHVTRWRWRTSPDFGYAAILPGYVELRIFSEVSEVACVLRMTSSEILNFVEGNRFRFWNRRYIDYFINVPGEHFVLRPHLRTSLAVIRLPGNFQQFFDLAWSKTSHGFNRYMHIPMRTSDFARFENTSEADSWVSRELAVQLLREELVPHLQCQALVFVMVDWRHLSDGGEPAAFRHRLKQQPGFTADGRVDNVEVVVPNVPLLVKEGGVVVTVRPVVVSDVLLGSSWWLVWVLSQRAAACLPQLWVRSAVAVLPRWVGLVACPVSRPLLLLVVRAGRRLVVL